MTQNVAKAIARLFKIGKIMLDYSYMQFDFKIHKSTNMKVFCDALISDWWSKTLNRHLTLNVVREILNYDQINLIEFTTLNGYTFKKYLIPCSSNTSDLCSIFINHSGLPNSF
eukprot:NODE_163_length_14820_cov_0.686502.p2 type:complete len:113 gc:universal NODE_163_length_14820_cov_0.686502:11757-12095(+)